MMNSNGNNGSGGDSGTGGSTCNITVAAAVVNVIIQTVVLGGR
jgi:hypothetical protein